jgi:hypothetical protein
MLEKMLRREIAAKHVVEAYGVAGDPFEHTVDHKVRDRKGHEHLHEVGMGRQASCRYKEDPIDTAVHEETHKLCIVFRHIVRVRNQKGIPFLPAALLQMLCERAEEAALDVRDDKAKRVSERWETRLRAIWFGT